MNLGIVMLWAFGFSCACIGFGVGYTVGQRVVVRMHEKLISELHGAERKEPRRAEPRG